jgi:predicted RNA binding protein YcfA (HicA-like mRNA interferase family)
VRRIAEAQGWQWRTSGDHWIYERPDDRRNLAIPGHRELKEGTLRQIIDVLGLTVDEFLAVARK